MAQSEIQTPVSCQPKTIDDIIARMDEIVQSAMASGSRTGYFAALYRGVTFEIKRTIETNGFANGPLMERLAVTFAERYLTALDEYTANNPAMTAPWKVAFDATELRRPIILQHLLLGMNAHINLDLAIASAETSPGTDILSLKQDFMQVNNILAARIPIVLKAICKCSPWIGLVTFFYKNVEEKITHFSLDLARDYSWLLAEDLAVANDTTRNARIASTSLEVKSLAQKLLHSKGLVRILIFVVALRESNNVRKNIEALAGSNKA